MKKSLFYLFALICSMSLFTACSDDDDAPDYSEVIDSEIAGGYKGLLSVYLEGNALQSNVPQKITVTKAGTAAINLSLADFSLIIPVGDVNLQNCTLQQNGSSYTFTGEDDLNVTVSGTTLTADIDISGTISDGSITVDLDIDAVVGQQEQDVTVTFRGTKLSGSENTEAQITGFTIDSDVITEAPVIDEEAGTITFKVNADATDLTLTPVITVSDGATVTPASGVAQDFSNGNTITYTVVSEDYGTTKEYVASVSGTQSIVTYTFDDWEEDADYPTLTNTDWATCNAAVALIKSFGAWGGISYTGDYPVTCESTDVVSGNAISMESVDTQGGNILGTAVPKVTAGTAFLGTFNAYAALTEGDPMATTKFGIVFDKKPISVTGYYKYTPGEVYYDADGNVVTGQVDQCALSAVLYEVSSSDETLNGGNIYTSENIVAYSVLNSEGQDEYTPFSLDLEYVQDYDASKSYKLAVIFSASKDGASYNAAAGSKLKVDEVKIISE
ncbi:MAG: PCMD domain-containing protein [Bacteroides sp.]|nr:PCMD domain-containing protein [Bacteroides sp.]